MNGFYQGTAVVSGEEVRDPVVINPVVGITTLPNKLNLKSA